MQRRFRAPPDVVALLQKEGLGWGHDVSTGVFRAEGFSVQNVKPKKKGIRK